MVKIFSTRKLGSNKSPDFQLFPRACTHTRNEHPPPFVACARWQRHVLSASTSPIPAKTQVAAAAYRLNRPSPNSLAQAFVAQLHFAIHCSAVAMSVLYRCARLLSPLLRKRCIAVSLVIFFLLYIYLLETAHSAHASTSAFSPTCQPVATESARAIQILRELQVSNAINCTQPSLAASSRRQQERMHVLSGSENSDFSSPFQSGSPSLFAVLRRLLWRSKLDVRPLLISLIVYCFA